MTLAGDRANWRSTSTSASSNDLRLEALTTITSAPPALQYAADILLDNSNHKSPSAMKIQNNSPLLLQK